MGNATLVVGTVSVVVAVVAITLKANLAEFCALALAIIITLAAFSHTDPTILPSGTECPGAWDGSIKAGPSVRTPAQWESDVAKCNEVTHDAAVNFLWILVLGIGGVTALIAMGRADRRQAGKKTSS